MLNIYEKDVKFYMVKEEVSVCWLAEGSEPDLSGALLPLGQILWAFIKNSCVLGTEQI